MKKKIAAFIILTVFLIPLCSYAQNQTLIMYYSKTGKTKIVAEELKVLMPEARLVEIKSDVGIMKAVMWQQLFNRNACNEPIAVDLEKYDKVILCSPLWLQKISSPMRTIINTVPMEDKRVNLFVVCAGHFGESGQKKLQKQLASKKIDCESLSIIKSGGKTDEDIRQQVREQLKN
jgi:menaquinone-dependent protoporphyrinogen IX oxidase